jgi:beta-xylosidase
MIEAAMIWNEPNNKSHWDPEIDPDWKLFSEMAIAAGQAIKAENPNLPRVLGGISPIDPGFIKKLEGHGVLDHVDVVAVHGFPLDWNLWQIHEWPAKIDEIRAVTDKPIWVSEVGISTFGAEEVQAWGQAYLGQRGRHLNLRRRGSSGLGLEPHCGTADRKGPEDPLVLPLRPAARMGGHDPAPGGGGLVLLPPFLHGPAA